MCFKATSKRINNAILLLQGSGSAGVSTACNKTKERHNPRRVIQKHQTFNHLAEMPVQGQNQAIPLIQQLQSPSTSKGSYRRG